VADAPTLTVQDASGNEDSAIPLSISSTLLDSDGSETLLIVVGGVPAGATLSAGTNQGSGVWHLTSGQLSGLTLTPPANSNTDFSLTMTARSTEQANGSTAQTIDVIDVVVHPINDAPVVTSTLLTTAENTFIDIDLRTLVSDVETADDDLVFAVGGAVNGSMTLVGDYTARFTPSSNYFGPASFTYTVTDGGDGSSAAITVGPTTVNVTVTTVNQPPVATNDSATVAEDSFVTTTVLTNDNAGPVNEVQTLTITAVTQGTNGTVTNNGNGTITYTPNANNFGLDSYTYTIEDSSGATATATVNVTVTSVNDPPVAVNDSATVAEDGSVITSVLTNDNAGPVNEVQTLTISGVTQGTNGTVTNNGNGTITYTPNANYFGLDSYTYTIQDSSGTTATATVNVTVTSANDPPVATNDTVTVAEDSFVTTSVLTNDNAGSSNEVQTLTISAVTQGTNGTVVNNGNGTITYTPNANYFGPDSYTYTIQDSSGATATATVNVTVTSLNDPPVATNDTATVAEDSSVTTSVLTNDNAGPSNEVQTLTISAVTQGTNGTVVNNGNGTITYTPTANYFGPDSYTYTIQDSSGATATATVNVTVTPVVDPGALSVSSPTVSEAAGTITFVVTLNDTADGPFTVNYNTVTGSAGSSDFGSTSGQLTFTGAAGQSHNVTVSIVNDSLHEADESFELVLSNVQAVGTPVTVATSSGTGTITNDDAAPTVTLGASPTTISENGGVSTVTALLSQPSGLPTTINLDLTGTAAGSDFSASASSITIPAGQTSGSITLTGISDALAESSETIVVDIMSTSGATEATSQQATVTLTNHTTVGADLQVTSTGSPSSIVAGKGTVTYKFTVKNVGTMDATGVKVSLASVLPTGVTVKSVSASKGSSFSGSAGNGTWTITNLKKKASVTLTVTITVGSSAASGANVIQSTATATFATQGLINTSNDSSTQSTSVTTSADVSISKHTAPSSVSTGGTATYVVTVTNSGPGAAANVSLVDLLPAGVTFVSQTQTSGPAFTLSNTATQVTNTVASLPSKASATFSIVGQVGTGVGNKQKLTNKATISSTSSDPKTSNNSSTATSTAVAPTADVSISKLTAPKDVATGGTITYSVTVSNSGPTAATNVSLVNLLPGGVTYVSQTQTSGPAFTLSNTSSQVTNTIASLPSKSSATFTIVGLVGTSVGNKQKLTNKATITSSVSDPKTSNNSLSATTTAIAPTADVSISKHTASKSVQAGGNVLFTVTVTNAGPTAASDVTLTDLLPAGTTFVQQTQASGPAFALSNSATQVTNTIASLASKASVTFNILVQVDGELPKGQKLSNKATITSSTSDPKTSNNSLTTTTSVVEGVSLNANPLDPSKMDLVVAGSSKNDTILVQPAPGGRLMVLLNGKQVSNFATTGNLVVYGRGGDDTITVDPAVTHTAILVGGIGNDKLVAGNSNSVLSGGDGNDQLTAGTGRNILIGGKGANTLTGTQGENILVGGYTNHDAHRVALSKLLTEWSRTDADYATRIAHLRGTTSGGLNETHLLSSTTAKDNAALDSIFSGPDDGDWILANTVGGIVDSIAGKSAQEELLEL
jgi:uncharacterized repeat protein (TIGR01451 family)